MTREKRLAERYYAEQEARLEGVALPGGIDALAALDAAEIKREIMRSDGNVSAIAAALGVSSLRLRKFILSKAELRAELEEVLARGVDEAISVLWEGVRSPHWGPKFAAAKEFLRSELAVRRGFKPPLAATPAEFRSSHGGAIVVQWLDPEGEPGEARKTQLIEGEAS